MRDKPDRDAEDVLRLLRMYGWNATAYQIVNPGLKRWFTPERDAVIAYVSKYRTNVVAGAPVCPEERIRDVVQDWEDACVRSNRKSCYFGAAGRLASILEQGGGYSRVALGAQPVWNPGDWANRFDSKPSLRAQVNRARNKGLTVEEWTTDRATENPALARVLREWLATRGLPTLHFLVEPDTLHALIDKRVFVASIRQVPVGFVTMAPVPARNGWLTEQFVRGREAPNGTVESIVDFAVRAVAQDGADYVTMGLVPLSTVDPVWMASNPAWLRALALWARAHGRRFYNFAGLEAFKTKFVPDAWEPIYAFSHEPRFSLSSLHAISAAFTSIPPEWALALGLGRALRSEARNLLRWTYSTGSRVTNSTS